MLKFFMKYTLTLLPTPSYDFLTEQGLSTALPRSHQVQRAGWEHLPQPVFTFPIMSPQ